MKQHPRMRQEGPHWPYTFERPDAVSDAVVVAHWWPDGPAKVLVDPSDAHTVPGIVDVEPGPDHPYWVIDTTSFNAGLASWLQHRV